MELKSHAHAAQGFEREIEKYNEQLEELEESLASGRNALKENENERKRLMALQDQIYGIEGKIGQKKQDLVTERTAISRQHGMLERDMTDEKSLEELQKMLQSFDAEFEGHREKKREVERQMSEVSREAERLREQQSKLQSIKFTEQQSNWVILSKHHHLQNEDLKLLMTQRLVHREQERGKS